MRIEEFQGGYTPGPIPPGFHAPPPHLPRVEVVEALSGDWSQAGKYGRVYTGPWPQTVDDVVSVFTIDRIPGPPKERLLHLFKTDNTLSGGGRQAFYARVTYGSGGAQNVFFCDWGGHVPLVADSIRVDAVPFSPLVGQPYNPPPLSNASAVITFGALLGVEGSGPSIPPTFTTPNKLTTVPSESINVPVPDFARRVIPNVVPKTAPPVVPGEFTLVFLQAGNQVKALDVSPDIIANGCALTGLTTSVQLFSLQTLQLIGLTFELGL